MGRAFFLFLFFPFLNFRFLFCRYSSSYWLDFCFISVEESTVCTSHGNTLCRHEKNHFKRKPRQTYQELPLILFGSRLGVSPKQMHLYGRCIQNSKTIHILLYETGRNEIKTAAQGIQVSCDEELLTANLLIIE